MFDILTVAAVADELSERVLDARIQKLGLVDRQTIAAELYVPGQRLWLLASADANRPRIFLTSQPPSTDPALITPFGLRLRKYVRGGILIGVDQPPLERLIRLSIAKRLPSLNARGGGDVSDDRAASPHLPVPDEGEDAGADEEMDEAADDDENITYVHLVLEIMGRHSNLMLLDDDGRIMEAVKHVSPSMSRVRPIRPGMIYTPPPPQDKPDPRRLTAVTLTEMVRASNPSDDLARLLVSRLRAVSPQMAKEVVYRATGTAAMTVADVSAEQDAQVAREMRLLLEPLLTSAWEPSVYHRDDEVVAFAAHPLRYLQESTEEVKVPSISVAIEMAEAALGEGTPQTHAQRRQRLADAIRRAIDRMDTRLASLEAQEVKSQEADKLREWGELIYAYLWQIQPGQTELQVDGVTIPLDPSLSAKDNAQAYFERYRKAQSATKRLPEIEARTEEQLAYLRQLLTMVEQARTFAELDALSSEWETQAAELGLAGGGSEPGAGGSKKAAKQRAVKRPPALYDRHGNAVYIGRSGRQNEMVTFDIAGADDTWLHARGVPGSHVVVKWRQPGADEDPETIEAAAALAAYYSAARENASVEVDVTKRRHVRKIKGAGPGMVTYRQERTIAVAPRSEDDLRDVLFSGAPKAAEVSDVLGR